MVQDFAALILFTYISGMYEDMDPLFANPQRFQVCTPLSFGLFFRATS
jgi:hypothetical protein